MFVKYLAFIVTSSVYNKGITISPTKDWIISFVAIAMLTPAAVPTILLSAINCVSCPLKLFTWCMLFILMLYGE